MCAVCALWISCCNHFYLLNYVKPFFYPTSVSLFISSSLSLSVMVSSFECELLQQMQKGRSRNKDTCWEISTWDSHSENVQPKQLLGNKVHPELSVNKGHYRKRYVSCSDIKKRQWDFFPPWYLRWRYCRHCLLSSSLFPILFFWISISLELI